MNKNSKTTNKLIFASFIFIVIIILAGGYFAYDVQVKGITKNRYNELAAIKSLKVKQIVDWRNERIGDARAILENPLISNDIKNFVTTKNPDLKEKILIWFNVLKKSYRYTDLILVDNNYNPLVSLNDNLEMDKYHFGVFKNLTEDEDIVISPLHKSNYSYIHFTLRITFRENGIPTSHILLVIDPNDFLFPLIQNWPTPSKTAETILVKSVGDSVVFLNELRHKKNTALEFKLPKSRVDLPTVKAIDGFSGMFTGYDYRGELVISDVGHIPGTEWFIITKVDEAEILGELKTSLLNSIIIVLLLIAIVYLIFLGVLRKSKLAFYQKEVELQSEKVRLSRLYATLSQINQSIVREQSKSELLLTITKLPVKFGGFPACSLSIFDEKLGKLKVESFDGNFDYFHKILNDNSEYLVDDPSVKAYNNSSTIVYDSLNNTKEKWAEIALKCGFKSCSAAPLKTFDKKIGSIILYSGAENFFKTAEIKLLEEIASDISYSLESIEKNEQRKLIEQKIKENERQLTTLFSNLPGIAYRCRLNRDYDMEFMSEGTLNITGYTSDEFVKEKSITYGQLIHPDDSKFVWDEIMESINNKKTFTIIYRIKTREGTQRWVWERGIAVYNSKGKAVALEGFISDITETKEAQDQLRKSEEYFRYLFEHNPLPMWIYNLSTYDFMEVNTSAIDTYGYSKDEFLSMQILDIRPEEEKQKLLDDLKRNRPLLSKSGEWKHKLKNGKLIDVLITSHQIEYKNTEAVLVVINDITDRKLAEMQLLDAKEKAEAGEKMKSDFLAQMSHEIRTPVNVILSFTNLIKDAVSNTIDDDLKEGFGAIDHASHRLIRTIDSILNMAQFTSGAFDVKLEELDVYNDILIPLNHEFISIAKSKYLEFTLENECEKTSVIGDRYSLSQLFTNLIDNAIKYTEQGFVRIGVSCDSENINVKIEDSGIGMSEDFIPKLFSAFSQEETGYSRKYEGTGLGLALVKNYCELNNASIDVKSKKNIGTTFIITLKKPST
jgi:PAS domain S-box-containing protein